MNRVAASAAVPLDLSRIFLIGAGLPAVIAALNYALLFRVYSVTVESIALYFVCFVLEVGLVGAIVGYHVERPWLRWTLYVWLMALINLMTFTIVGAFGLSSPAAAIPPAALFAGQIGLCVTWACFGDGRWQVRVPAMAAIAGGLYFVWGLTSLSSYENQTWNEMLLWQVASLSTLCVVLRLKGFRLSREELTEVAASGRRLAATQFGIRDVLILTTVLAVLLGIARALDMLSARAAQDLLRSGAIAKLSITIVGAIAIVVALWMALGSGSFWVRYPVGISAILFLGLLVAVWSRFRLFFLQTPGRRLGSSDFEVIRLYETGPWWIGWLFLSGGLLAATLIILRARGYRLVRVRQMPSNGGR